MTRQLFHHRTLLALCLLLAGCQAPEEPPASVFLVTVDTLRADHLGGYGYPRQVSPFIDRLAAGGVLFIRAYASSSTTVACHASLFTSLQPPQHQMTHNGTDMHPSLFTMAEMFRRLGYDTAGFSTVGFMKSLERGFDVFDTEPRFVTADHVVDKALAWLGGRDSSRPFFLWIHLFDVHEWFRPRNVAAENTRHAAGLQPGGADLARYLEQRQGLHRTLFDDDQEMIDAVDRYDGQIVVVDRELRRLFDAATDEGLNDEALWVFTSDHGEGLGSHGFKGHGARIYNEQLQTPLIFYFADGRYGRRTVDRLVRHVDVLPTLADLLGTDLDQQVFPVVGHSLRGLLEGRDDFPARYAFSQRRPTDERRRRTWEPGNIFSVQTLDHKFILHSQGDDELYDLERDPLERVNLAGQPHPMKESLREYATRLHRAMTEQGEKLGGGTINPEYVEELRALGYL